MLSEKINTAKSLSFRSRCQRPEGAMGNGKSCTADLKPKINNLKALQKYDYLGKSFTCSDRYSDGPGREVPSSCLPGYDRGR